MPVTLLVRTAGADLSLPPVSFDGPRVVLGRSAACDLRLPDASVSGRHASIRSQNAMWVVVDEGSTNGTFLNGERLAVQSARKLESGDRLGIGRMQLDVKLGAARPSTADETRELAVRMVSRATGAEVAKVSVSAGPDAGATLEVGREPCTIGRDPRCKLRLTDRAVSSMALEVTAALGRVLVRACDERTEARLGGRPLGAAAVPWMDRDLLVLGETTLTLEDPIARALDASAELADERVAPYVPPPPQEPEPSPVVPEPEAPAVVASERPKHDRRGTYRSASRAFELLALVVGLLVLGGSIAGLVFLLRK